MKTQIDVPVPMRDGTILSTDIRLPDGDGPFPVILIRTPYSNTDSWHQRFVPAGYACAAQDCRGRFDSLGRFDPFHEATDGYDTIAWLRAQPWCDGRVGMSGGSYLGFTQLTTAPLRPPGLLAITPRVMGRDAFRDMLYDNGVFCLQLAGTWGLGMTGRASQAVEVDWQKQFLHLPLMTLDETTGLTPPHFREWLSHPVYDEYWKSISIEARHASFDVPGLHMGGWYDPYGEGTIRNFEGIQRHGGPNARGKQKLIIGPWAHGLNTRALAQTNFGFDSLINLDAVEMRWLDRWVRGVENGIDKEPPVRIFVMGVNMWRDEQEWPPARAREKAFHLASGGRANSVFGDGALVEAPSNAGAASDSYVYNPDNPVPTVGGALLGAQAGPLDHMPIERRDDVLVYSTPPLTEPIEVTGYVRAVLHVATDAPDTDFIARLCDVQPDGRSLVLCDGIVRTRFREGLDREVMMTPGRICELTIDMFATSNVFLPGHRIRLEITSSCFPRWARNLNTGEPFATSTRMQIARQTVHHSPSHPSRLVLPIVPVTE